MLFPPNYPPAKRGTIVLWGLLASSPFGGMTWQVLHHLAGIRRLGFDVWYVEDSDRLVYHPTTYWPTFECDANVAYLARQMHSLGSTTAGSFALLACPISAMEPVTLRACTASTAKQTLSSISVGPRAAPRAP
jgi:hypothetical protein